MVDVPQAVLFGLTFWTILGPFVGGAMHFFFSDTLRNRRRTEKWRVADAGARWEPRAVSDGSERSPYSPPGLGSSMNVLVEQRSRLPDGSSRVLSHVKVGTISADVKDFDSQLADLMLTAQNVASSLNINHFT